MKEPSAITQVVASLILTFGPILLLIGVVYVAIHFLIKLW